ncbi:hypothetical protein KM043_000685 [Ampulex compressa]|nr:hypothetical protein KM043_000685 [Ampulex compressa]
MLVLLIPYFLVARLAIDENAWRYGPEFVFDVQINMTTTPLIYQDVQRANCTWSNLYCQPKKPERLSCRLGNTRGHIIDLTKGEEQPLSDEKATKDIGKLPFEIEFDKRGVHALILDRALGTEEANLLKKIAEMLSIGADLSDKRDGTFVAAQNCSVGHCNVTFDVRHYPFKNLARKTRKERFELESLPRLNKVPGEALNIEKTIDLRNCSFYAPRYYGTYHADTVVHSDIQAHLVSSINRIFVSDTLFVSSITKKGTVGSRKYKDLTETTEIATLTLRNIQPAKGEPPKIQNPGETRITANWPIE